MIGALAIKNRRKKLNRNESQISHQVTQSVFTQKCNILFVAAGVFFIVGFIVLIPVCFGDTNFLIYSGSSFAVGIVIFIIACLFNTSDTKDTDENDQVRRTSKLPDDDSRMGSSIKRNTRSSNGNDLESGFTAEIDLKTEVITSPVFDVTTSQPLQDATATVTIGH